MKFSSNEEVHTAVDGYFEDLQETFFKCGMMSLETRRKKYVDLQGDYVEK